MAHDMVMCPNPDDHSVFLYTFNIWFDTPDDLGLQMTKVRFKEGLKGLKLDLELGAAAFKDKPLFNQGFN